MKITIECNDLKELHSVVENMCILLPEKPEKNQIRDGHDYRDDLHTRIMALHNQGKKVSEIAKAAGCSQATVYNHLKRG